MTPLANPIYLLIMSDDLGYEAIGANGCTSYDTPRLDQLAETGIRFDDAHVMPLCTPTRVSLMTGKYNFRNYIGFGLLDPSEVTMGHIFSQAGYKTCISGKWQLYSYNPPNEMPEDRNKGQKIEDALLDVVTVAVAIPLTKPLNQPHRGVDADVRLDEDLLDLFECVFVEPELSSDGFADPPEDRLARFGQPFFEPVEKPTQHLSSFEDSLRVALLTRIIHKTDLGATSIPTIKRPAHCAFTWSSALMN